nr:MAG TPA: hypothetical protein [Caudoviricetes sp.]
MMLKNFLMLPVVLSGCPRKVHGAKLGGLKPFFKPRIHHADFKTLS